MSDTSTTPFDTLLRALAATDGVGDSSSLDLVGKTLAGRYRVERSVGRGGMGVVFAVHDLRLDREAALKILSRRLASDASARARFVQEARAASCLRHPRIVTVYDFGEDGDELFIVMELVKGRSLRKIVRSGGLDWKRAVAVVECVADALCAAHARGVLHRDVKPDNVVVHDEAIGEAVLLDFGLARVDRLGVEDSGGVRGTPLYLSPERARGIDDDPRSDLYALGVTAYEALGGGLPFEVDDLDGVLAAHSKGRAPRRLENVPHALSELVLELLASDPSVRPPTADAVLSRLGAIRRGGRPSSALPVARIGACSNLMSTTALLGRDELLEKLRASVEGGARLLTLAGAGGAGKTALSRSLARSVLDAGVLQESWFVDATDCTTPDAIAAVAAAAAGVPMSKRSSDSDAEQLGEVFAQRGPIMVVLDNLEQAVDAAAHVISAWLSLAPELRVVATSREVLHIPGEIVFEVGPLAVDDGVELLEARSRERGRELLADEMPAARDLVERLDALPLAIELAAGRTPIMRCDEILEHLGDGLDLLSTKQRRASRRQLSLRNAIDWSWNLLDEHDRRALAQCSVFRGGFDMAAAGAILSLGGGLEATDVVQSLRTKSLLTTRGGRLTIYETIRVYAAERLAEMGELDATQTRHARYYEALAERHAAEAQGERARRALAALSVERENILAAREAVHLSDPERGARLLLALEPLHEANGPVSAHRAVVGDAIDDAERSGDDQLIVRAYLARNLLDRSLGQLDGPRLLRTVELARSVSPGYLARALINVVRWKVQHQAGEYREELEGAEAAAREADDPTVTAIVANDAAMAAFYTTLATTPLLERAIPAARAAGHVLLEIRAASNAAICVAMYDTTLATQLLTRGIELTQLIGNRSLQGMLLGNLGFVLLVDGRYADARDVLSDALRLHRAVGDTVLADTDGAHLVVAEYATGNLDAARTRFETLRTFELPTHGQPHGWSLMATAALYADLGLLTRARALLEAASHRCPRGGLAEMEAKTRAWVALVLDVADARERSAAGVDTTTEIERITDALQQTTEPDALFRQVGRQIIERTLAAFPAPPADLGDDHKRPATASTF